MANRQNRQRRQPKFTRPTDDILRTDSTPEGDLPPWAGGDPMKKIGTNVPFPEPLMFQMDWLVFKGAIRSKSSFIRDSVSKAAEVEVMRVLKMERALSELEKREASGGDS